MKIVITGYTYTRKNLFDVFESYPEKENLYFFLPNNWKAKNGQVIFKPFTAPGFNIKHSRSFFFHSDYPIIGGLMKGWMPALFFYLPWYRFVKKAEILFTTGEPNLLSTLCNAVWAKMLGMKHVFHYWENISYESKDAGLKLMLKKFIIRLTIYFSDGAICGMKKAEGILKSLDKAGSLVIGTFLHAGFSPEKFKPGLKPVLRTRFGLENKTVFLFVGALGYRKGLQVAIKSLAELSKKNSNLALIIVGSGEYKKELESLVDELSLREVVYFIPWMSHEELPQVYCSADVFIYPSIPYQGWEEQFGYSIAEASLSGLPIISTQTGSIDEVIVDGDTGIMVSPDDVSSLVEAMKKLASDPDERFRMGKAGRELVKTRYGNKVIAQKIYNFFKHVGKS